MTDQETARCADQTSVRMLCGRCDEKGRPPTWLGLLLWDHPANSPALLPPDSAAPVTWEVLPLCAGKYVRVVTGSNWQRVEFYCPKCARIGGRRYEVRLKSKKLRLILDGLRAEGLLCADIYVDGDGTFRWLSADGRRATVGHT